MLIQMPQSNYDNKVKRIENWIDKDKITSFQGYEDGTITITFDNGLSIKFGPYEDVYDEVIESLIQGGNSRK